MKLRGFRDTIPTMRALRPALRVGVLALLTTVLAAGSATAAERGQQLEFGVDMARRGLWAEALFRFERAAREEPNNPRIINNLAVAHEAVGKFDRALELYREAVRLDPANATLKRNYARFVEFYQSFRPTEESGKTADEQLGSTQSNTPTAEEPAENGEGEGQSGR